ncbi:MAG: hypothetical protein J6V26_05425 [Alistipes sp.]|jgi:hypothetical protein|nr:hypothetical protein [Alistipes sp.]
MKLINRLFATILLVATLTMAGCEKPAPLPSEERIPVTYAALDGCWQLTMWQGATIAEDTYLYIVFDRSAHTYVMWDNIDSMYATDTTGTFVITEEEDGTYTLSGMYDYGIGDWSNDYSVTLSDGGNTMQWRAASTTMDFVRIEALPEFN